MLTQQQISRKAAEEYRSYTAEQENAFAYGATWASAQYATEIARLEGEKAELLELIWQVNVFAPAGSDTVRGWIETRLNVRKTLEKYGM